MAMTTKDTVPAFLDLPYERYLIKCDIRQQNRIFHEAIRQVIVLNERIRNLKALYERAAVEKMKSFRYSTRLRLCAIEGTRNMFFEFAHVKCNVIEELQERLREVYDEEYDFAYEDLNFVSDDDDDDDDSYMSEWSDNGDDDDLEEDAANSDADVTMSDDDDGDVTMSEGDGDVETRP